MKINIHSISIRLVLTSCVIILIPLAVVGYISTHKSANALREQSSNLMELAASDIASLVDNTFAEEKKLAQAYSTNTLIKEVTTLVNQRGVEAAKSQVQKLRLAMKEMYKDLGQNYLGIFVTDATGKLYTGERADGSEYKGSDVSSRGYFKEAKRTGKAVAGDLVKSKSTGKLIVVFCAPIFSDDGKYQGIFGMPFNAQALTALVNRVKMGETGYALMVNQKGILIAHPNQEYLLKLNLAEKEGTSTIVKSVLQGKYGATQYSFEGNNKFAGYAPVTLKGWGVILAQNSEEVLAPMVALRNTVLVVTLAAMILAIPLIIISSRRITTPINLVVENLKDIAQGEGDLTKRLAVNTKDEVGEMAQWFNVFIEKLQGIIKQLTENAAVVGASVTDLTGISAELSSGAVETSQRSENLSEASEEMTTNLNNVAAAMEQSSTNTSMVAAAAEEMTSTINEIAENAEKARDVSGDAVNKSQVTSGKMAQLGSAAKKIGQVTETITEISEQTNLLALNATIEAARAGEAGKGFAVVANEIKDLAKQTSEATLDIKSQIEEVQQATDLTVTDIKQISDVIGGVNEIVSTIAAAVEQQSAATQEIANNINQASMGIQEVNENVGQSSVVASEINKDIAEVNNAASNISGGSASVKTSAENLAALATELNAIVNIFKV